MNNKSIILNAVYFQMCVCWIINMLWHIQYKALQTSKQSQYLLSHLNSPLPSPVFEISTRNRFAPLLETERDTVIIGSLYLKMLFIFRYNNHPTKKGKGKRKTRTPSGSSPLTCSEWD